MVIDPAYGVARWTGQLLEQCELSGSPDHVGSVTFLSTGDVHHLGSMAQRLIGETGERLEVRWEGEKLVSE
jgi:hypothetical protein